MFLSVINCYQPLSDVATNKCNFPSGRANACIYMCMPLQVCICYVHMNGATYMLKHKQMCFHIGKV